METRTIFFVGVGGQGILLASDIAALTMIYAGYDIKKSEVHGMAQRGGSVTSFIRFNREKVYSPLAPKGEVDILVAFEKLEALRYIDYVRKEGMVIVNDYRIDPMPVSAGIEEYPKGVLKQVKKRRETKVINAFEKASEIGDLRVINLLMLGALSKYSIVEKRFWTDAIKEMFSVKKKKSDKIVQMNLKAFDTGLSMTD